MATVDKRYITALGPIKMEVMFLSALTSADTVTSNLASPSNAMVATDGTGGATVAPTAAVVTATKVVTITQTSLSAGTGTLIVFGF